MKVNMQTISVAEAAFILRAKLGTLRNWTSFLTDNIRGKQSIAGQRLFPCAKKHDGRSYRPVYNVDDVNAFVAKVLSAIPLAGKAPIKPTTLTIDTSKDWKTNKFKEDGTPAALLSSWRFKRMFD